jgi:hypothetical protein
MLEHMTDTTKPTTPKEVFLHSVKATIGGNKNHGWGADDSMAVIKALYASEVGSEMDDVLAGFIKKVVNPSAFRQELEKAGALTPKPTKVTGLLAELVS